MVYSGQKAVFWATDRLLLVHAAQSYVLFTPLDGVWGPSTALIFLLEQEGIKLLLQVLRRMMGEEKTSFLFAYDH
jgi:hypothetical protein